jgi:hypothetical protein
MYGIVVKQSKGVASATPVGYRLLVGGLRETAG